MILKVQRIATIAMVLVTAALLTAQVMIARASSQDKIEAVPPAGLVSANLLAPECTTGWLKVTKTVIWNGVTPQPEKTFSICIQGPSFLEPNCKIFGGAYGLTQTWADLVPGQYTISEPNPGPGWASYIPSPNVTVIAGETALANVYNGRGSGTIQVRKVVAGSPPDPNQVFNICLVGPAPETAATCQDFKNGEVKSWTGLAPGDYTLETNPGSAWVVSIDHPNIRINLDGSANYNLSGSLSPLCTEAIVTNTFKATGQIDVRKVVDWNGATPNPDQAFSICLTGPSFPQGPDCKTFRDGEEKTWTGLAPGIYTVSEENPGSQWSVTIDHPTIQVNPDGSLTWLSDSPIGVLCNGATVTNKLESGGLTVTKTVDWAGMDPVQGQTFSICIQGPSFPTTPDCKVFTYPNNLVQSWNNLAPGDYTVSEPGTGTEWKVSVPPSPVTVSAGGEAHAAVANTHKRKVSLTTTPQPLVEMIGAVLNDSAVLSGGTNPTGLITFNLFAPNDAACSGTPVYTQNVPIDQGNGAYNTWPGYTSNQPGVWNWTADYSGDTDHLPASSGCTMEAVTIRKASPSLTTEPNPAITQLGEVLNDSATFTGGYFPTGTILFNLFAPNDASCSESPVYTQAVPVQIGLSYYATAPGFASNAAGTWRWTANYSGDANNNPARSGCQDENVTVEKARPEINTVPNPSLGLVGDVLNDSASMSGFFNPTGSILLKLFPPTDAECTGTPVYTQAVSVNGNNSYTTNPGYPSDQAGTWRWTADYSGDANNLPASSGCTLEPVTIKNRTGSIHIKKHVEWNGVTVLPGQTFEICLTGPDTQPVTSCKTFSAEQVQSWDGLTPGTYTVTETDPGNAWKTTIEPSIVTITPAGTASVELVTVANTRKLGKLQVTKHVDWNGSMPDPLVSFEICINGPSYPQTPDCKIFNAANGWIQTWENLIPGEYTLSETNPGNEWKVIVPPGPVVVPVDGGTATVQVANQRKRGSLAVTKTVNWNGVTPLQGQTFNICIMGPSFPQPGDCKTFTYPDTLIQTWTDLVPGNYLVMEKGTGAEWQVETGNTLIVVPIDGGTGQAHVTNTRKLGSLQVVKTVDWKEVLPDPVKTFNICIQGPSYPDNPNCKVFGASAGWVQVWNSLIPGSYTVSEENAGDEWVVTIEGNPVTVPLDGGSTGAIVTNSFKAGGLTVVKAVDWGTAVPDPEKKYEICVKGPSFPMPDCKYAGYMGGELTWQNLIPGEYEVTETDPGMNWKVAIPDSPNSVRAGTFTTFHVNNKVEEPTGINMVFFKALRQADKRVKLVWLSAIELNISGFKIYRSQNPDFNTRQYAGFIQAGGGGTSYQWFDAPPTNGCWYYWLVSVDTNDNAYVMKRADVVIGDYFVFVPVLK